MAFWGLAQNGGIVCLTMAFAIGLEPYSGLYSAQRPTGQLKRNMQEHVTPSFDRPNVFKVVKNGSEWVKMGQKGVKTGQRGPKRG